MRTIRKLLMVPLVCMLALPAPALAQDRHLITPATLADTLAGDVARDDVHRATIREALARPEVRDLATKSGIDLDRVAASVDTLDGAPLARAAAAAQQVNQTLVGGASTVVISTTTIIIALLVVLLIVVAVD